MYTLCKQCPSNAHHLIQRTSILRQQSVMSIGSAFGLPVDTGLSESGAYMEEP